MISPPGDAMDVRVMLRSLPLRARALAVPFTAALVLSACGTSSPPAGGMGSVGVELDPSSAIHIDTVAYGISGNGFNKTGVIDVSNSTTVSALIGGIPAASAYTIVLSASDAHDPTTVCSGSAAFNIAAGAVTHALVHLQCRLASRTGSVLVGGAVNVCPSVTALSVEPAETSVGHAVALSGAASDADAAPGPLTYVWTSSGGTIAPSLSNAQFTCTTEGTFTVALTVGDGDCTGSASATVTCSQVPDGGSRADGGEPAIDAGPTADASDGGLVFAPWPGPDTVVTIDDANTFGTNMSGLAYQPATASGPAVLWAVQNSPSKIYHLVQNGALWTSTTDDWAAGKNIHYPGSTGNPDSEGITQAELDSPALYVSTERNNDANTISRLSVLRYDSTAAGVDLTATNEWELTSDLPTAGPNLGLEAIAWVPDTYLVGQGFIDESTGQAYDPSAYADHGTGIFFVGLEQNGVVYAFALNHVSGAFRRVATVASGHISIMDLSFDRDNGALFTYCDNTCGNHATVLAVDTDPGSPTRGHFKIVRAFQHPAGLPDQNNEGITIAPESECQAGLKSFFWSDDNQTDGHALRRGSIPCGSLF